jgi:hypothetical protein
MSERKEGRFSNPPKKNGGQECPPSVTSPSEQFFLNAMSRDMTRDRVISVTSPSEQFFLNAMSRDMTRDRVISVTSPSEQCFLNPYAPVDRHKHHLPHWQQGAVFYFVT